MHFSNETQYFQALAYIPCPADLLERKPSKFLWSIFPWVAFLIIDFKELFPYSRYKSFIVRVICRYPLPVCSRSSDSFYFLSCVFQQIDLCLDKVKFVSLFFYDLCFSRPISLSNLCLTQDHKDSLGFSPVSFKFHMLYGPFDHHLLMV